MTEQIKGKSLEQVRQLFSTFHQYLTGPEPTAVSPDKLGKLAVLGGVREFPMRIKCATLAWHTLKAEIEQQDPEQIVTTE